jgi:hypothetical protein
MLIKTIDSTTTNLLKASYQKGEVKLLHKSASTHSHPRPHNILLKGEARGSMKPACYDKEPTDSDQFLASNYQRANNTKISSHELHHYLLHRRDSNPIHAAYPTESADHPTLRGTKCHAA